MKAVDFAMIIFGLSVVLFCFVSFIVKKKIDFSENIDLKVCPKCKNKNFKNARICVNCSNSFDYNYGDDVCLSCGYTGRMKRYSSGWFFKNAFAYLYIFSKRKYQKVCRNCNRLIRPSDYEKQ